jgi:hypothetical protein
VKADRLKLVSIGSKVGRAYSVAACALLLLLASSFGAPARAEPSAEDRALATELFRQGRELMASGQLTEACPKLAESHRLDAGGGTVLNLGLCYEADAKLASAWSALSEALSLARRDRRADRERLALERISAIEPRLSRLAIVVPPGADLPGLSISRNGAPVRRTAWDTPMPVDGGSYRIEVTAPDHAAWTTTVDVGTESDQHSVTVPLLERAPESAPGRTLEAPRPAPRAATQSSQGIRPDGAPGESAGDTQRIVGFAIGGVGLAAIGVGSYFGLRALDKKSESSAECRAGCSERGAELSREAGRAADVSTVSLALGAAALGAGTYLVLTSSKSGTSPAVGVAAGPGTVQLRGRF